VPIVEYRFERAPLPIGPWIELIRALESRDAQDQV